MSQIPEQDELRTQLSLTLTDIPESSADLSQVRGRSRRIRRTRYMAISLASVTCLAGLFSLSTIARDGTAEQPKLPSAAAPATTPSSSDRAASFAVRAVADSRLLEPSGDLLDYQGITEDGGAWIATFTPYDCESKLEVGTCVESADAQVEVVLNGDRWEVSDASGPIPSSKERDLLRYTEEANEDPARFEFPYVEITNFPDSTGIETSMLWTGPIPSFSTGATCEARLTNPSGKELYRGAVQAPLLLLAPQDESQRSGSIEAIRVPDEFRSPPPGLQTSVVCDAEPLEGWTQFGEVQVQQEDPETVVVRFSVVWRDPAFDRLVTDCAATVYASDNSVLGTGETEVAGATEEDLGGNSEAEREALVSVTVPADSDPTSATVDCNPASSG